MNNLLITILVALAIIVIAFLLSVFLLKTGMLKNWYDVIACFSRIGLPAGATLLLLIGNEFELYKCASVSAIIVGASAFIDAILMANSSKYFSDKAIVEAEDAGIVE